MIQSMTGFGRGEANNDDFRITIEIKSVNHRYCDVSVRLPRKLNFLETTIRNYIKDHVNRGKIDIFVNFEDTKGKSYSISYNKEIAKAYYDGLNSISNDFNVDNKISAYMISKYPEVFSMTEEDVDEEVLKELVIKALDDSMVSFVNTRNTEGEKLRTDLIDKLNDIKELVDKIRVKSPKVVERYRKRITEKVNELLGDSKIDDNVLASEIVVYSDKVCVDEEMVRLDTHIDHMITTLNEGDSIGRKLDFITQEMNRESNTILSKSDDVEVSDLGIQLKTEIEKIREQIQNIE